MVTVLLCGTVLVVLNQTLLSPALPAIMADLQVSATTVQWLTSGYSLVEAIIIPLSAYIIGKLSTRKLFCGGLALFAVGSLVAAFAPGFPFLLLGRVLQACATGAMMPMVISLVLIIFPRERRGTAMGIVSLVISFAPAVGPSLSGVLVDSVGWRALFVIVAVLTVIMIVFGLFALYNYEGFEEIGFDKPSVCLSSLGLLCLLYGFSTFSSSDNLLVTVALVVVGILLIALFARRQLKLEVPLLRVTVLASRRYRTAAIIIALLEMALIGSGVALPLYIQNVLGHTATVSGLAMLPGAVIGAACGLLSGRVFDRFGVRGISIGGGLAVAVAGVLLALLTADASIIVVACVYSVFSIGIQLLLTPLNTWGLNSLDNSVIQHANALSNTLNQIGGSFGTALIVSMSGMAALVYPNAPQGELGYLGQHLSFVTMAVFMVAVFVAILVFVRNKDTDPSRREAADRAQSYGIKPRAIINAHAGVSVDLSQVEWLVGDVMNPNSPSLSSEATVRDAVNLFSMTDTSGFPVTDGEGRVVGFLSDGDLMKYLAAGDSNFSDGYLLYRVFDDQGLQQRLDSMLELNVRTIATRRALCLQSDMLLEEACKQLSTKRIKKMPVVDDAGKLVGCLSRRNIISAMSYYLTSAEPVFTPETLKYNRDIHQQA